MKTSTVQSNDVRGPFRIIGLRCGHIIRQPYRYSYYCYENRPRIGEKVDCVACSGHRRR